MNRVVLLVAFVLLLTGGIVGWAQSVIPVCPAGSKHVEEGNGYNQCKLPYKNELGFEMCLEWDDTNWGAPVPCGASNATAKEPLKVTTESRGPFSYSCDDGIRFSITFYNSSNSHTATIKVNGATTETLEIAKAASGSHYSGTRYSYDEWHGETTLTDSAEKSKTVSCHQANPHSEKQIVDERSQSNSGASSKSSNVYQRIGLRPGMNREIVREKLRAAGYWFEGFDDVWNCEAVDSWWDDGRRAMPFVKCDAPNPKTNQHLTLLFQAWTGHEGLDDAFFALCYEPPMTVEPVCEDGMSLKYRFQESPW